MLLKDIFEKGLVDYKQLDQSSWKKALCQASEKLIEKNYIRKEYVDEIISNVEKNGDYIVIVPGIAMPHALAESANVLGTAIGFTKFSKPVIFDKNNPSSQAQIFFTLAAKDPAQHLKNISDLSDLLMKDGLIEKLLETNNVNEFKKLVDEYSEVEEGS